MGDERDAFYVVKKGTMIGVYKSLNDLQILLRSSVNGHAVSVFKGYNLSSEAAEYLASHGLQNAMFSVDAQDVQESLFGRVIPCPFREPAPSSKEKSVIRPPTPLPDKRLMIVPEPAPFPVNTEQKHSKLDNFLKVNPLSSYCCSCVVEFDGASKGNPGLAGAGAVIRTADQRTIHRVREGVGIATNNVAEYRGLILGLKYALEKGFKHIRAQGDSKLVCMQVQGLWKTKNQNMAELCKVAKELRDQFVSFEITHIEREYNGEADSQANLAVYLKGGEIQVDVSSS